MAGGWVHDIDPVLADVGNVHLWWYGLGFALGFLQIHQFLGRSRTRLGLSRRDVWTLTLFVVTGVLVGGRFVAIVFDEWSFYREHPELMPAIWLGGMATHGLFVGAAVSTGLYALVWNRPLLVLADALVIPGAFLMGVGRIGNFIDGQIVGSVTDVWWAVEFPHAEGFRHPVVLYDGVKNVLLVPFLLYLSKTNTTQGAVAARFVFWYAFPRIFIDLFRDYPLHRLALGTGQTLNIAMAALGVVLLARSRSRRLGRMSSVAGGTAACERTSDAAPLWAQRIAFAALLLFCLMIPSNWTQNIPARYGGRHAGLMHSFLYPAIDWAPPPASALRMAPAPFWSDAVP